MKLSIIVPVYNMAADNKLNYCMDSLVNQSLEDFEIIAVDDASTDDSLNILRDYEAGYPQKVKVIHYADNRRQGGAKNAGMKLAAGEWIGFIDSDDWVIPEYYETLINKAIESGADMVGCDYNLVNTQTMAVGKIVQNNQTDQTGVLTEELHKKLILRSGSMVIKIYKREVLVNNHLDFPEHIFYEDNCAGPLWSLYFTHFEKVNKPMYYYYQHDASTVHYVNRGKCEDRMSAAQLLITECNKRGFMEQYREEIEFRFTELYYAVTLFSYVSGVKHRKLSFLNQMKRGVRQYVSDFQNNHYYQDLIGEEEKKLIRLHMKSSFLFLTYYIVLNAVRNFKERRM